MTNGTTKQEQLAMSKFIRIPILILMAAALQIASPARADLIYTLNDTTNGVSATANFTLTSTGFVIAITNTESNTPDAGHAISQFSFTVNNTNTGVPTAFSQITGTTTDFNGNTNSVNDTPSGGLADHWQFTGGSTTTLDALSGGQPDHLIAATGSTPNSSLTNTHLPSFIGTTYFYFTDSTLPTTLTTADITGFKFAFGTTPEVPLEAASGSGVTPFVSTPEPATITMAGLGLGAIGLIRFVRKAKKA
jgi:PEP-CTERM motif